MKLIRYLWVLLVVVAVSSPVSRVTGETNPEISAQDLSTNASSMALRTIEGKLLQIDGEYYVVEDPAGQQVRVHVGERTVLLSGAKKPGDAIRAIVKKDGHALTVK